MSVCWSLVLLPALVATYASAQSKHTNASSSVTGYIIDIPYSWTYLLPDGFEGNVNSSFINATTTSNSTIDSTLRAATKAPFIAYDPEFYDIFGTGPEITLVQDPSIAQDLFAFEAGVWVPERDEVWFTSSTYSAARFSQVSVLNLNTLAISALNSTPKLQDANGGYYFQGKVYFATFPSNTTFRGGVYSVDVKTLQTEPVINSYFGLPLLGPDDVVWATKGSDKYMYFSDLEFSQDAWGDSAPVPQVPSGVWRWDPQAEVLQQVISRNEVNPNGIRVSPDQRVLYVTDSDATYNPVNPAINTRGGASSWLGPYIYKYDLDEDMYPVNRRVFGFVRENIADGIHVDDAGRVWTAEGEGIVIRSPKTGKILGLINGQYFLEDKSATAHPIANFALAGDKLVIGAVTEIYVVQLAKEVVSRNSTIVN